MTIKPARLVRKSPHFREHAPIALVTGAGGALGGAIAHQLAEADGTVVLVDIDGERVSRIAQDIKAPTLVIEADLSRPEAAEEIMALVGAEVGRIDWLVNNAGMNLPQSIYNLDIGDWDKLLAVNLRAPALMVKAALPLWRDRRGAAVVNIGSRIWLSGAQPAYSASKAGIVGLTRSMAVELARLNVRVNAVAPSYIDTPMTRYDLPEADISSMKAQAIAITPLGRNGVPQDVAHAVSFLLSEKASFITGEILHVCGGSQLAAQPYSHVPPDEA
ncbi:SDR family NAD(P)-dependent oxidoreductase [Sinorhizobium medicae]|uniref:SDR family NAD(P)-dependent oxidoreductase n=1 Tax=Sinorhizobium medicae TaxID=110321 RepID=UPI000FDC389F|nr:SDR family oxidoreductase [Sinorhizobium medicae]RVO73526.1 SDR family oxidoreductase [Sinorhizobium medicae]